jgi:hypothetical protein
MSEIPSQRVSARTIQDLFNAGDYAGKVRAALLYELILRCRPKKVDHGPPGEPPGTLSQVAEYFDRHHNRVAVVHRYVRPDGRIGASGKIDPKYLLHDGTLYIAERK